jgi:hypothetical protein
MSEDQDWTTQPPYAPPPPSSSSESAFTPRWTGTCHCGRVRYHLSRERPLATKYCHCRGCQVLHGSPFQWAAIFEKTDMAFENGAQDLVFYSSGSKHDAHELPCKVACRHCRSPIMDEGRKMALVFPTLIEFGGPEERALFAPECHLFYSQRVCDIPDGKPKWTGLDKQSELMDETKRGK